LRPAWWLHCTCGLPLRTSAVQLLGQPPRSEQRLLPRRRAAAPGGGRQQPPQAPPAAVRIARADVQQAQAVEAGQLPQRHMVLARAADHVAVVVGPVQRRHGALVHMGKLRGGGRRRVLPPGQGAVQRGRFSACQAQSMRCPCRALSLWAASSSSGGSAPCWRAPRRLGLLPKSRRARLQRPAGRCAALQS
jgi:hypothetical protein